MSLVRKQEGEKDHANYTQQLIDLHDQYLNLVQVPFENNQLFQKVLKEAFEVFVNKDIGNSTTAELLSTFCDNIMKTGGDKLEGEIDSNLDKIVMLFSYLSDKDMFAEFYRKQLAKRLLLNRSASDDDERSLITKLKVLCTLSPFQLPAACAGCECAMEFLSCLTMFWRAVPMRRAIYLKIGRHAHGHERVEGFTKQLFAMDAQKRDQFGHGLRRHGLDHRFLADLQG
jgi:hypothetical protein